MEGRIRVARLWNAILSWESHEVRDVLSVRADDWPEYSEDPLLRDYLITSVREAADRVATACRDRLEKIGSGLYGDTPATSILQEEVTAAYRAANSLSQIASLAGRKPVQAAAVETMFSASRLLAKILDTKVEIPPLIDAERLNMDRPPARRRRKS